MKPRTIILLLILITAINIGFTWYSLHYYAKGTNEHIINLNATTNEIQNKLKPLLPDRKGGHIRKPKEA